MLTRRATAEGFLQFIRNVSANEHSFAIGHLCSGLLLKAIQLLIELLSAMMRTSSLSAKFQNAAIRGNALGK